MAIDRTAFAVWALLAALSAGSTGCSAAGDASGSSGASPAQPKGETTPPPTDASYLAMRVRNGKSAPAGDVSTKSFGIGQTTAGSLSSLAYYVTSIAVCKDLVTQGTATSDAQGCLQIYRRELGPYAYDLGPDADWTPLAEHARHSDDGFVDLMSATSRAQLAVDAALGPDDVHEYGWGVVGWALPVKIDATIPMNDGTSLYTHDGTTERRVQNGIASYATVASTTLTSGPSEKAVALLANGGTWFKFQSPLVVTQADLDAKRSFVVDLVFNPEGLVKGYGSSSNAALIDPGAGPAGPGIAIPLLDLTPVPHRVDEVVVKETYVATISEGSDDFDVRLELYSVKGDPNRTLYGIDAKTLVNEKTSSGFTDFAKIAFVETAADGLVMQSWDKSPAVSGFARRSAQGETTTARIHCVGPDRQGSGAFAVMFASCPPGGVAATFTLVAVTEL